VDPAVQEEGDEDEDEDEATFVAQETGEFDEIVVWNHDQLPERAEDRYMRGVEEWIGMAEAVSFFWYATCEGWS
jgi:ribonuclease H2 subunit C